MPALNGASEAALHDPFVDFVERMFSGSSSASAGVLAVTVVKLAAFVGFMLVVGRRVIPWCLHYTAHTGSRELFRLAVLAIALGVAAGAAYLFGVSLALGAFFAGMILSESELSHRAAQESLPLRDAFAVLFFVVGRHAVRPDRSSSRNPLPVLATVFIIVIGKSVARLPHRAAVPAPGGDGADHFGQPGADRRVLVHPRRRWASALGILPPEGRDLILAGAIISIVLNPVVFCVLDRLRPALESRFGRTGRGRCRRCRRAHRARHRSSPRHARRRRMAVVEAEPTQVPTGQTGHVILIGYGRVGSVVGEALLEAKHSPSSSSRTPRAASTRPGRWASRW